MPRFSPIRSLGILLVLWFLAADFCRAQGSWVQSVKHQQTVYVLFGNRIERYNSQTGTWLPTVTLPAAGATAIAASERGVQVAIGTQIHGFTTDLTGGTVLATTPQAVVQLLQDEDLLIATLAAPTGISATILQLPAGAPVTSSVSTTLDLKGASVAVGRNRLYGRSGKNGPNNIIQVSYSGNRLVSATSSPVSGGVLPNAARTWVFPDESRVVDDSGTVYAAETLTWAGALGGSFTDLAFRNGSPVVLRGNRMGLYDTALRETSVALLSASAGSLHLTDDAAVALIAETSTRGVRAERVPFSAFAPAPAVAPASPVGLAYVPDQILMDRNGVVLLYSAAKKTIFRWSTREMRYLEGIGLQGAPAALAYSPVEHAIYLGYSTGAISRVAATGGAAEVAFANVPTFIRGLVATGTHVLAVHNMFNDDSHTTFDLDGRQIDTKSRRNSSATYEYAPGNRKVFWMNDRTTAGILHGEVIGADGKLGPEIETTYSKPIIRDNPPIRANAAGTRVAIGRGVIFAGDPLKVEHYTLRLSTDMGWVGSTLETIETRATGNTAWHRWTADWNIGRSRVLEGTPLRVLPDPDFSAVVTSFNGAPRFYVLDRNGDITADSIGGRAPVIASQPESPRVDYGGTAHLRVHVTGSGPFTYVWSKDGEIIPNSNSADLFLENAGSSDAGTYRVAITGPAGSTESATARLGVGPIRGRPNFTPGNLLVCSGNRLLEVRTDGSLVRAIQVPNPYNGGFSHRLEDVAMDRLGRIHVIHSPFEGGNTPATISTLDPEFNTWTHVNLYASFSPNWQEWDLSLAGDTLVTNRMVTMDVLTGHVHRMPPIYNDFDRPNLTGGVDGRAHGIEPNGTIASFDPVTWQRLVTTRPGTPPFPTIASAAADGTLFATMSNSSLARMEPGTTGKATYFNLPTTNGSGFVDMNLSKTGRISIGNVSARSILLTSTAMNSASIITLADAESTLYSGWAEAPEIPAPGFAASPPPQTLEDVPFVFDPQAGHVDPDAGLVLTLEAAPSWLAMDPQGRMTGTPLAADIGTATVRVTATDRFGVTTPLEFQLEVVEVNDNPQAVDLHVTHPEDQPRFVVDLHALFEDEETADADLVYRLISAGDSALAAVELAGGALAVTPVQDAYGETIFTVEATDAGGLSVRSQVRLTLTPVNDAPVFRLPIPDQNAGGAGLPIVLALADFIFDADPGDILTWKLDGISNPGIFSQVEVNSATGLLEMAFAPYVSGASDVTVTATDGSGAAASFTFRVTLPALPLPEVRITSAVTLNRQTGLLEQTVTVTNSALRDIAGFDLNIRNLPVNVVVRNATSAVPGIWTIAHRQVMKPGAKVSLVLEYYSPQRITTLSPALTVVLVTAPEAAPTTSGAGLAVSRCERLGDGSVLVEFKAVPGHRYEVSYMDGGSVWKVSPVIISAGANRVQWIDRGPPRTESSPAVQPSRFYRVRDITTP